MTNIYTSNAKTTSVWDWTTAETYWIGETKNTNTVGPTDKPEIVYQVKGRWTTTTANRVYKNPFPAIPGALSIVQPNQGGELSVEERDDRSTKSIFREERNAKDN